LGLWAAGRCGRRQRRFFAAALPGFFFAGNGLRAVDFTAGFDVLVATGLCFTTLAALEGLGNGRFAPFAGAAFFTGFGTAFLAGGRVGDAAFAAGF
jgi:hypothetical protein